MHPTTRAATDRAVTLGLLASAAPPRPLRDNQRPLDPAFVAAILAIAERRPPDFIIGGAADPYMLRWYLDRQDGNGTAYLHRILRSDDDRALHDHVSDSTSLILQGGYVEVLPAPGADPAHGPFERYIRAPGDVVIRRAGDAHRLELAPGTEAWSLFLHGPVVREWGFHCPQGWVHNRDFTDPRDPGAIGPGCGD